MTNGSTSAASTSRESQRVTGPHPRRLRIAYLTATFPPYWAGTGNVCFHNARELARLGHDVHVFTASLPGAATFEVLEGIEVHRLRPLVRIGNAPLLLGLLPALRGFDVLHLQFPFIFGAELARLAAVLYRTPLLLTFQNDLIGQGARGHLFTVYQRWAALTTVRRADRLCVVSRDHYEATRLRRTLGNHQPPIEEVPNGVDPRHFRPTETATTIRRRHGLPDDAKVVLFVAALDKAHHFKGLDVLLDACRLLSPGIRLVVVGDGDLLPTYRRQAEVLGIGERVTFVGAVAHEATQEYFSAAQVTVLPSSPPESFGLVLIESLACGVPAIASDIPGVRVVVDHGRDGRLVERNNPAALATAITEVLGDEEERRTMGRRGRAKVESRYDWARIGEQLETLYAQTLAQRGANTRRDTGRGAGTGRHPIEASTSDTRR